MPTKQILEAIIEDFTRKQCASLSETNRAIWDRAIGIVRDKLYVLRLNSPELYKQIATGSNLISDDTFDNLIERRLEKIRFTLTKKAQEYATSNDRFHNFKVAAQIENTTPEKALKGMMVKHEVSVKDLIEGRGDITAALIDEKIGDNINYLILLEGLLKEKLE